MEKSGICKSCKRRELETDYVTGNIVCSYCGISQCSDNFEHHFGGFNAPTGTFIRTGTSGSGTQFSFKQVKVFKAKQVLSDITSLLNLSDYSKDKVLDMFDEITEGEFGQGNWLPVCLGACSYVVMRKDDKPLSLSEVAGKLGVDVHELGRMVKKVVAFLGLKLSGNDVVDAFEKGFRACFENSGIGKDVAKKMNGQGVFVVQCLVKWWVTTGRRPLPVVVAVLVFVAQLNDVDVSIEDVAVRLHAVVSTSKKRYKELLERLVEVAKRLPWGKDITVKNILKNAPFVIHYIELKSMSGCSQKGKDSSPNLFDLDNLVGECLSTEVDYSGDNVGNAKDSRYFELEGKTSCPKWNSGNLDELKISHECLSMLYSEFSDGVSDAEMDRGCERGSRRKRVDIFQCWDWWNGKSELSKKLVVKKILEKDIGFDMMPQSFVSGCLANSQRREKIKAAKLRIDKIMNPLKFSLRENDKPFLVKCKSVGKRRRIEVDTDWEDFIVETLLLHQVEEEEIEKGHYSERERRLRSGFVPGRGQHNRLLTYWLLRAAQSLIQNRLVYSVRYMGNQFYLGMWGGLVNELSPAGFGLLRMICHHKNGRGPVASSPAIIEALCNIARSSDDWQYMAIKCLLWLLQDPNTCHKVIDKIVPALVDLAEISNLGEHKKLGDSIVNVLQECVQSQGTGRNSLNTQTVEQIEEISSSRERLFKMGKEHAKRGSPYQTSSITSREARRELIILLRKYIWCCVKILRSISIMSDEIKEREGGAISKLSVIFYCNSL